MIIDSLYRNYMQKSKVFLYPLLNIKRGVSVTPIQTFMNWKDKYCFTDSMLITQYHMRDDSDFRLFENVKLLGNKRFHEFHLLNDGTGAYVFDFKDLEDDFWKITIGKYSQLSANSKKQILDFFKNHPSHHTYLSSYLYPERFHTMYSEILDVKLEVFKQVHELCSLPDLNAETLDAKILINNNNQLNLHQ